jgi:hypothetical protein
LLDRLLDALGRFGFNIYLGEAMMLGMLFVLGVMLVVLVLLMVAFLKDLVELMPGMSGLLGQRRLLVMLLMLMMVVVHCLVCGRALPVSITFLFDHRGLLLRLDICLLLSRFLNLFLLFMTERRSDTLLLHN